MADKDIFQPRLESRYAILKKQHELILKGAPVMKYFIDEIYLKIDEFVEKMYPGKPEEEQNVSPYYYVMGLSIHVFEEKFKMNMEQFARFHKIRIRPYKHHTVNQIMKMARLASNWDALVLL